VIYVVTPVRLREREVGESRVKIVNMQTVNSLASSRSMCSDTTSSSLTEKRLPLIASTVRHFPGGIGEAATILATASRRFDWTKAANYLDRIGSGAHSATIWLARRSHQSRYSTGERATTCSGSPREAVLHRWVQIRRARTTVPGC